MADVAHICWWHWIPWPWKRWRIVATVTAGDEIPDRLPGKAAVLVSAGTSPTWVAFDCPCGRGHRIMLNLNRNRKPHWSLGLPRCLTLSPSVDDLARDRRCHFFMRNGRVEWVRDTMASIDRRRKAQ
jgi:hypothetical protein